MKQEINPVIAIVVVIVVLGIAVFAGMKVFGKKSDTSNQVKSNKRYQEYEQRLQNQKK